MEDKIKLSHTPSYAEEQLEHAIEKETICYNKECNRNDKNGSCRIKEKYYVKNCTSRDIEQPIQINYEEEYKKLEIKFNEHLSYINTLENDNENLKAEKERLENDTRSKIEEINKSHEIIKEENERLKKEVEEGYQCVENEYENKLFLAEQKANESINSLMLLNDKYMEKQKTMESDLIKYEDTIKTLKGIIKNISEVL